MKNRQKIVTKIIQNEVGIADVDMQSFREVYNICKLNHYMVTQGIASEFIFSCESFFLVKIISLSYIKRLERKNG